jgi:nucleoside-diphosphate-sugar epimerase
MQTCLIVGIDSFTGSYVEKSFKKDGYRVFGTTYAKTDSETLADTFPVNLLNAAEVDSVIKQVRPDVVIHLAGISYVVSDNPKPFYDVHIIGTRNLLSALTKNQIPVTKVILASTAQVYGDASNPNESTLPKPLNDYAVSKLAMEYMAKTWIDRLPIIIARPFNYIGIGQSKQFVIPKLISAFKSRQSELKMGRTDVARDFSDVRFIAKCYYALAKYGIPSETYNLASAQSHSIQSLIDKLTTIASFKPDVQLNPQFIRQNDPAIIVGNNHKITTLDPSLTPIPIRDTLQWIYNHDSGN